MLTRGVGEVREAEVINNSMSETPEIYTRDMHQRMGGDVYR
jgi:hypothetical protein